MGWVCAPPTSLDLAVARLSLLPPTWLLEKVEEWKDPLHWGFPRSLLCYRAFQWVERRQVPTQNNDKIKEPHRNGLIRSWGLISTSDSVTNGCPDRQYVAVLRMGGWKLEAGGLPPVCLSCRLNSCWAWVIGAEDLVWFSQNRKHY